MPRTLDSDLRSQENNLKERLRRLNALEDQLRKARDKGDQKQIAKLAGEIETQKGYVERAELGVQRIRAKL
jgi:hypothetical protein